MQNRTDFELEEALYSHAPIGLHCCDCNGLILWANNTELKFLGRTKEEYVGKRFSSFVYTDNNVNIFAGNVAADDRNLYSEVLKRVISGNPISDIPIRFVTRSGTVIHLLLDCDGTGILKPGTSVENRYFRFFTRDDTARRIQEMRSNVLFQETNRSLQMLDNFMNRSMQQMRKPLTLMERACNLVTENFEDIDEALRSTQQSPNPAQQGNNLSASLSVALSSTMEARSVVGLASTLTKDALGLVDDITDLAKFDQGRALLIDKEAVKLRDVCLEALTQVPIPTSGGMIDVILDIQQGAPSRTMADKSVLQRCLALLLNFAVDAAANAASSIGDGTKGKVILSVSATAIAQPQGVQISVLYSNPDVTAGAPAVGDDLALRGNGAMSESATPGIGQRKSASGLPAIFREYHSKPDDLLSTDYNDVASARGGSRIRRFRLRKSILEGMTGCRRDKLGLGLSLVQHLVGALGSDLRYEIVDEQPLAPSLTKFWFNLPISLDFPHRLAAETQALKDLKSEADQLDPFASRPELLSSFAKAPEEPQLKRAKLFHPIASAGNMNLEVSNAAIPPLISQLPNQVATVSSNPLAAATFKNDMAPQIDQTKRAAYPGVTPGTPPLILVVEDTDVSATLICMHLRKLNCTSHRAENGEVALEMLRSAPAPNMYSLILMDLRMPVMDGFEAAKIIKGSNACNIPIVALTGETSIENKNQCDEIGFDDYRTKPLKKPELKQLLLKLVPGWTDQDAAST